MPLVEYKIDPFADTIITLRNPCRNFAPSDEIFKFPNTEIAVPEDGRPVRAKSSKDDVTVEKLTKKEKTKARFGAKASVRTSRNIIAEDDCEHAESYTGNSSEAHGSSPDSAETAKPVSQPSASENEEIYYLVSSRHLMLASPWFMRTLTCKASSEAVKDPSDGRYHIQASDWDEEALLHLLNIFHIRSRQVPATVSLEMLAKIAILVDYYELEGAEVTERDTTSWIKDVKRSSAIPSSYCRNLMLWICISQVFNMSEVFEQATSVAIRQSQGCLQTLGLPIREAVISKIEQIRCDAIEYIVSELHSLLETYRNARYSCPKEPSSSFQCGVYLFGGLTKVMESWSLLSPRPTSPFTGMSLDDICARSEIGTNLYWCHETDIYRGRQQYEVHPCSLDFIIREVVKCAMVKVEGLRLQKGVLQIQATEIHT